MLEIFQKRLRFIEESFKGLSWDQKYKKIIQWGRDLDPLEESKKEDQFLVKGCQSSVWLRAHKEGSLVVFTGDSNALITKGLLALVIYFYTKTSAKDILITEPVFMEKLNLSHHLTPTRTNGLVSMIKQIQNYAKAFSMMEKQ